MTRGHSQRQIQEGQNPAAPTFSTKVLVTSDCRICVAYILGFHFLYILSFSHKFRPGLKMLLGQNSAPLLFTLEQLGSMGVHPPKNGIHKY
jgi:hypothetical protein